VRDQLNERRDALLKLSHELGREDRGWAILGEGNASARIDADSFLVKASGSSLGTLQKDDIVQCKSLQLLSLLDRRSAKDQEVDAALYASRIGEDAKKPSVEALFHGYLLSLPGIEFVGHTHAPAVNQVLCSTRAREFAVKRIFPDEVVCCGSESVFIPYTDPGLKLAQVIKKSTEAYYKRKRNFPRVIVLQNHGIITIGATPQAVLAAMMMAEKSASIWLGSAVLGGPVFMSKSEVDRIASRQDEDVRRRAMKI
jgi:rhamnose utilization protein RhaD (predicted bifunctional aldolase and dehydrogenase)